MRYHSVDSRCWVTFSIRLDWTGLDRVSELFFFGGKNGFCFGSCMFDFCFVGG